jgi:glycosyltransferase 2 family protein
MSKQTDHNELEHLTEEQRSVLRSLRSTRIILPIILGLSVVGYLLWRQLNANPDSFNKINWTGSTFFWIFMAICLLVLRHLAFSYRMYILSQGHFSFRKCIELIFIFEFSLCVTPTTVGGSAVSLFVMTQERLSGARTATIVVYKVVLDTIFFVGTLPFLYMLVGPTMVRPGMEAFGDLDWRARIFYLSYVAMATYGLFFFYGLFINPIIIKKLLVAFTNIPFLTRFREGAIRLGNEIVLASQEMKNLGKRQHFYAFLTTLTAWTCKFFLISCLIYGIGSTPLGFWRELQLYSRLESMFVIMAFSPSPGGAGFAEATFHPFLLDFVPDKGVAIVIAFVWRLMSYYAYLAAGAIIVPNWIRKVFLKNLKESKEKNPQNLPT